MSQLRIEVDGGVDGRQEWTGGDILHGRVCLDLHEGIEIDGVRLELEGNETSVWSSVLTGFNGDTYGESHEIVKESMQLFGNARPSFMQRVLDVVEATHRPSPRFRLDEGHHQWTFDIELALDLPPSYRSRKGSEIVYTLRAIVEGAGPELEASKSLRIVKLPEVVVGEELDVDASKTFLFEHGKEVKVHVSIPRDYARPGEHLPIHVDIRNETRRHLRDFVVTLFRKEIIRANDEKFVNIEDLHSQVCDLSTVVDQGAFEFDIDFVIPPSTEPSVLSARLIHVLYGLRFTLDVPWALQLHAEAGLRIDASVGKQDVVSRDSKTRAKL